VDRTSYQQYSIYSIYRFYSLQINNKTIKQYLEAAFVVAVASIGGTIALLGGPVVMSVERSQHRRIDAPLHPTRGHPALHGTHPTDLLVGLLRDCAIENF
jgi:hypothetical protein